MTVVQVVIKISKITDHLTSTEKVLWHRKPDPKAPKSKVKAKIIPILITAILLVLAIVFVIPPFLMWSVSVTNLTYIILAIVSCGIIIQLPLFTYTRAKDAEYLITNKRVIIYKAAYVKKPWIINLSAVCGDIEMKYNKSKGTGSIHIPNPEWVEYGGDRWMHPDLKNIKDPHKVRNILIEAIAYGKSTKWKYEEDPIFK